MTEVPTELSHVRRQAIASRQRYIVDLRTARRSRDRYRYWRAKAADLSFERAPLTRDPAPSCPFCVTWQFHRWHGVLRHALRSHGTLVENRLAARFGQRVIHATGADPSRLSEAQAAEVVACLARVESLAGAA